MKIYSRNLGKQILSIHESWIILLVEFKLTVYLFNRHLLRSYYVLSPVFYPEVIKVNMIIKALAS